MVDRHRNCQECARQFSYVVSRGMDRKYCSEACSLNVRKRKLQCQPYTKCPIDGCDNPTRPGSTVICEMHYGRLRRNGNLDLRPESISWKHSHGYVVKKARNHPLSTPGQRSGIYEHRIVFYEKEGAGPFDCFHCGTQVTWSDMHVDHLNDVKTDNRPENLVASCPSCNTKRGQYKTAQTVIKKHGIDFNGERLTLIGWARRIGVSGPALRARIRSGWPLDVALTKPKASLRGKSAG